MRQSDDPATILRIPPDDSFEASEAWGVHLLSVMTHRFRSLKLEQIYVPGPSFQYERSPGLFAGRMGRGPLRLAWDTNILVDYFEHGAHLWRGEPMADLVTGEYGEELDALQILLALYVVRDIEIEILRRTVSDFKSSASEQYRDRNRRAMREFETAIHHFAEGRETSLHGWDRGTLRSVAAVLPAGADRDLAREALTKDVHVFLTRDKALLSQRGIIGGLGLQVLSPGDLLEELAASGNLNCLLDPTTLLWPMPDQERIAHLIRALPPQARP